MNISVIGLGKLGCCTAACFAAKGFQVTGIDINQDYVDTINRGEATVFEPGLQDLISSTGTKLKATSDFREAILRTDISFIIVPTPSKVDGNFSDQYLRDALLYLSKALKSSKKKYHLFVITSSVSPGTIDNNLIPLIENESGKMLNKDFGVCYNPEFIALGSVINDFFNPDIVLIGESDKKSGNILNAVYKEVCESHSYFARMSIISAEITKISLNSYITMKISFANTLSNICESIPGAEIDKITNALGADKRVSPYYIKGGLGFGGPCFPRDNKAFAVFAKKYGIDAKLAYSTDQVNEYQNIHLLELVLKASSNVNSDHIAVLGLSYKPKTPVIEESPSVSLIEGLLKKGRKVIVYDPLAIENAKSYFKNKVLYASSIIDCFKNSSICVIATQSNELKSINRKHVIHNPTTIIDCWRILDPKELGKKVNYIALGKIFS